MVTNTNSFHFAILVKNLVQVEFNTSSNKCECFVLKVRTQFCVNTLAQCGNISKPLRMQLLFLFIDFKNSFHSELTRSRGHSIFLLLFAKSPQNGVQWIKSLYFHVDCNLENVQSALALGDCVKKQQLSIRNVLRCKFKVNTTFDSFVLTWFTQKYMEVCLGTQSV